MRCDQYYFQSDQLQSLLERLQADGFNCIGPQARDGSIVFDSLTSVKQLPQGISDQQKAGSYSLINNNTSKYFDWANGPQAIKPLLFAAREPLWVSEQADDGELSFSSVETASEPTAIIGARACDVAAMNIQDMHFLQQQFVDPYYQQRRQDLLIIAVNCGHPAETCFCHATGDGPFISVKGADIVLTELDSGYLLRADSEQGKVILDTLDLSQCSEEHVKESTAIEAKAARQHRRLPNSDIKSQLMQRLDDDSWQQIAERCLSCGNCTAVCPTCFCHSENDLTELDGKTTVHSRDWDSCFSQGHSYIHGITIRSDTSQRYRQWITHKFSSWVDQYGRSGCVGCGRCITWCPVGIDVTESIASLVEVDDA